MPKVTGNMKPVMLITGAAGFIGNVACQHYRDRFYVIGVDNMSRETAVRPEGIEEFYVEDATNYPFLTRPHLGLHNTIWGGVVLHLAGQVSVTESLKFPVRDMENNA